KVVIAAVLAYGLATVGFGLSRWFPLSLLLLAATGAADTVSTVMRQTIRQLATPDRLRGRATSINMMFFMGGPQLGEIEAGVAGSAGIGGTGRTGLSGDCGNRRLAGTRAPAIRSPAAPVRMRRMNRSGRGSL